MAKAAFLSLLHIKNVRNAKEQEKLGGVNVLFVMRLVGWNNFSSLGNRSRPASTTLCFPHRPLCVCLHPPEKRGMKTQIFRRRHQKNIFLL